MVATQNFVHQLFLSASTNHHRYGLVLKGEQSWQQQWLQAMANACSHGNVFQLGGEVYPSTHQHVGYSKGQRLLGQECHLLICDFSDGFDANSFSAALGCVVGGGLVVILPDKQPAKTMDAHWLQRALAQLIVLEQHQPLPPIPALADPRFHAYEQQHLAIEKIRKVVEGHRKRPLVMTADRGRGKSSALGIAAAQLMQTRNIQILVTAPTLATIQPVFEHASRLLPEAILEKGKLTFQGSTLLFVAPDELLRSKTQCDCLFVDEASAIPIPMLKQMVEHYHRAVFSTTVHGYEGCGRGFTLKFQSWLAQHRPGYHHLHLDQPIRWNDADSLEAWHFQTFLLDAELQESKAVNVEDLSLRHISKSQLYREPHLLRACFALLVNAHYQTSPNDLMLLLSDDDIQLYAAFSQEVCVGCILTVAEGEMDDALVAQVQLGKRRPKGHLVASSLANQLGIADAARLSSVRIMRIAVHPQWQGYGVGQQLIAQLKQLARADFYSTSFGATSELVAFWQQCGFTSARLGSARDQASGTHSLIMVSGSCDWIDEVEEYFRQFFQFSLSTLLQDIEVDLVRTLCGGLKSTPHKSINIELLLNYTHGGASYDSIAPLFDAWWLSAPSLLRQASDLVIRKLVQRCSWEHCIAELNLVGRKQAEQQLRDELAQLLSLVSPATNLHCKQ